MRAVVQRVNEASVTVDGEIVGRVGAGFLVLLGVSGDDTEAHALLLAAKVAKLRVFKDEAGKMNLSVQDCKGAALVVSQFTLYADTAKGNRPSFITAAPPKRADELYRYFCRELEGQGVTVETGRFGADMKVALVNDGPVTICLDTDSWKV